MTDQEEMLRVFCYSPIDNKIYLYKFSEEEIQATVDTFMMDIWFYLTDEEVVAYLSEEQQADNLKQDFIWFRPGVNKMSIMECTCGHFLESGLSYDRLAKAAVRHSRKTGHVLNPRGN